VQGSDRIIEVSVMMTIKTMKNLFIPFLFLFSACSGQSNECINCYFPVKGLLTGQTYCFVNQNDTTEKSYWKLQTIVSGPDTLFQTEIYDRNNRLTETMTEKIEKGSSSIISYTLYDYNPEGIRLESDCKILDAVVFKEKQKKGEEIQWKVNFKDNHSSSTCELTKIRTLKSTSPDQRIFDDQMKFAVLGTTQGYKYAMTSVYQKNIGLVSFALTLPHGEVKDFVLTNRK
jgi:hypothetical protein